MRMVQSGSSGRKKIATDDTDKDGLFVNTNASLSVSSVASARGFDCTRRICSFPSHVSRWSVG
jgi:hypothetical protein